MASLERKVSDFSPPQGHVFFKVKELYKKKKKEKNTWWDQGLTAWGHKRKFPLAWCV